MTENSISIRAFTGSDVNRYIHDVAKLRIEVFREFPYLYVGDMEYENKYLKTYIENTDSIVVIAFDGDRVIGASTAIPLMHETSEVRRPFIHAGINVDDVFYLGESVLQGKYRGRGIGVRFFEEREAHARRIKPFKWSAFCAVERPDDHPRRPKEYIPLEKFWNNRGYSKRPDLNTTFTWQDLDENTQSPKRMVFWLKPMSH